MNNENNNNFHYDSMDLLRVTKLFVVGAAKHGSSLGLPGNTCADIMKGREALMELEFSLYRAEVEATAAEDAASEAKDEAFDYVVAVREHLKPAFGPRFSQRWLPVGYESSLKTPPTAERIVGLLEKMQAFFLGNPAHENAEPEVNVTAARCAEIAKMLSDATTRKKLSRKAANRQAHLRQKATWKMGFPVKDLVEDMEKQMAGDDPRWREFGLNLPSATLPKTPSWVHADSKTPGEFHLSFKPSEGATHYRFYVVLRGTDAEPRFIGESTEPSFRMENVQAGQEFDIYVAAANEGGESRLSWGTKACAPKEWSAVEVVAA